MDKKVPRHITQRTFSFSLEIIKIVNSLSRTPAGIAIGNQVIRSGTSIGANTEEAQDAFSKKEFIYSMNIALKEARETYYWLRLILESNLIPKESLEEHIQENLELVKILTAIVKKAKIR